MRVEALRRLGEVGRREVAPRAAFRSCVLAGG